MRSEAALQLWPRRKHVPAARPCHLRDNPTSLYEEGFIPCLLVSPRQVFGPAGPASHCRVASSLKDSQSISSCTPHPFAETLAAFHWPSRCSRCLGKTVTDLDDTAMKQSLQCSRSGPFCHGSTWLLGPTPEQNWLLAKNHSQFLVEPRLGRITACWLRNFSKYLYTNQWYTTMNFAIGQMPSLLASGQLSDSLACKGGPL